MSHDDNLDTVKRLYAAFGAGGNQVVVLGYEEGSATPTGRSWKTHFVHAFTLAGGKITGHREYIDTQAIADAFRS